MSKRKFLYLCPEFPPSTATGAIRPARFARTLPDHGWEPIIVTLRNGRGAVETGPICFYESPRDPAPARPLTALPPLRPPSDRFAEWLPMGGAAADQPAMIEAGRRALANHDCAAVVVNAPPVASSIAARRLARDSGLPLIVDLRDPWGPCELRAQERPPWTRMIEGRAERALIRDAVVYVLNTETAHADYRAAFPQIAPEKFRWLRNAVDRSSLYCLDAPTFPVFTILFAGSFNRHVSAAPLLALARALSNEGIGPDRIRVTLTAQPPFDAQPGDQALGYFDVLPRQPQGALGAMMQAADILVMLGQATRQRLPLKLYDYLHSDRPVLAVDPACNAELRRLVADSNMGEVFAPGDGQAMAAFVARHLNAGRHPVRPRDPQLVSALSLDRAARKMAAWLDEVADQTAQVKG